MTISQLPLERDEKTGRYILRYDASLHSRSNCLQYVWNRLFQGLTTERKDFKMEYGTAFHKALAHWYRGHHDPQECVATAIEHYSKVEVPPSDYRSIAHLVNCLMQYFTHYGENDVLQAEVVDGEYLVEKNFAYPFYRTDRTELLLTGTIDMKGRYCGRRVIADHKTTSSSVPGIYLAEADLSPQLMTYVTLSKLLFPSEPILGAMLNGIFLGRTNKNVFQRSEVVEFNEWQLNHYMVHLSDTVKSLVNRFEAILDNPTRDISYFFSPNFTECKQPYGMCEFAPLCRLECQADREMIASTSFVSRKYDPLQFQQ